MNTSTDRFSAVSGKYGGGNQQLPKIIIGVVVLVIALAVVLAGFVLRKPSSNQPKPVAVATIPPMPDIKQTAIQMAAYLKTQRRADGFYDYLAHFNEQCTNQGGKQVCPFNGTNMFPTTNAWTALGFASAFEITGDPAYLDQAKQDTQSLVDYCLLPGNTINCRGTIWQLSSVYTVTKDAKLLNALRQDATTLVRDVSASQSAVSLSAEASGLSALATLTNDKAYQNAAQQRLNVIKSITAKAPTPALFTFGQGNQVYPYTCSYSLGFINTAIAAKSQQGVNTIEQFLNGLNLVDNFGQFGRSPEIEPCIATAYTLFLQTKNPTYKTMANNLLSKFLADYWDNTQNKRIYGEGGIAGTSFHLLNQADSKFVSTTFTGYTLYLLSLASKAQAIQ